MWVGVAGLFVVAGGACLWAARQTLSLEDGEIRRPLLIFFALTAGWALSNILLVGPVSDAVMHASYIIGLIFGHGTVVVWLWFCSAYVGTPYHYSRRVQTLALGSLAGISAVKLTNPLHEWYFQPAVATEPFRHFAAQPSLLYWLVAAIAYIGATIGLYLLFDLYNSSQFKTTALTGLTLLITLPVVPKLLAVVWPDRLLLIFYEPLGAAVFAVGILTVSRDTFLSVRAPARRQLAGGLNEIVIIVDEQDRIADYNQSANRVFERLTDDALGKSLSTILPEVASQIDGDAPCEIQRETGPRYYTVQTPPIKLGRGTVGRAVVLSDITELEAQRRRLQQQTEHMEAVTSELAHQLRNPLTILKGQLELLQTEGSKTGPDGEDNTEGPVAAAVEATTRIETITDDLLSVINHGKPVADLEPLVLGDVVESAIAGDVSERLTVTIECEESVLIRAERTRCSELFRFLFQIHHQRGASEISVERAGATLTIRSDGEPFTTETPERLFEYGVETDDDARMLLANARTLAEVHGWSIRADIDRDEPAIEIDGITFLSDEE